MKNFIYLNILIILSILLSACPYSSPYSIDATPQQDIDESLLGKWATLVTKIIDDQHSKTEPVKIIVSKKSDIEYNIAITGYIEELRPYKVIDDDTIKGTAFLSTVANKSFINVTIAGRTYLAEVRKDDKTLSIYPLSDHFTNFMVKSNKALRVAIDLHYKTRLMPVYDEDFILRDLQRVN